MTRHPNHGGIAADMARVLDHRGVALLDGVAQLATPVMAVDTPTDLITGVEIIQGGRPHRVPRDLQGRRYTGYPGEEVTHGEAQLGVQAQSAGVIRRMHEAHARAAPCGDALEHMLHEVPADGAILHAG